MVRRWISCVLAGLMLALLPGATASAGSFFFTTGEPDGLIASVSHPEGRHATEHESADDFILKKRTVLNHASFFGVLYHGGPGEIREVVVELYHVFPKDSNTTRTPQVPTRVGSPHGTPPCYPGSSSVTVADEDGGGSPGLDRPGFPRAVGSRSPSRSPWTRANRLSHP